MKIFLITETLFEGGAESFVLRLARSLHRQGYDVQVISLNKKYENPTFTAAYTDFPIKRLHLSLLWLFEFADKVLVNLGIDLSLKYYFQKKQLRKTLASADIVHSHYIQVDHLLTKLKKELPFQLIVTMHGDYAAQYKSFEEGQLRLWLKLDQKLKQLAERVDHWVAICDEQLCFLKEVMHVPDRKVSKIYNGYEPPSAFTPAKAIKSGNFIIGMVARGHKLKGWEILIEAFFELPQDSFLILVGGGNYIEELQRKYSYHQRIIFAGFQPEPLAWLLLMDVFVLPTCFPFESLPTVITEALWHGVPVIATNVGEIKRMITEEETGKQAGLLISLDEPVAMSKELAGKLTYLYQHRKALDSMKANTKAAAVKFDMKQCTEKYIKLYKSISLQE
jgi:glycosyltransferase involved in cell wall biosynthesis